MTTTPSPAPAAPTQAAPVLPSGPVRLREVSRGKIRFSVPGTDYRIEATPGSGVPASAAAGQRLDGALHATARKVWSVPAGGRFVEPVFGRPRRIQGFVLGSTDGAIWVDAGGLKVVAELGHAGQRPEDFPVHSLVTFSVDDHAEFRCSF